MTLKLHIASPLEKMKTLLSESAAFQTLMDETEPVGAAARIHYGYGQDNNQFQLDDPDAAAAVIPRTILHMEDFASEKTTTGSWTTDIQISMLIQTTMPQVALQDRYFGFLTEIEGLVDDVREATLSLEILNIVSVETAVPPQKLALADLGNMPEVWTAVMVWGIMT